MFFIKKYKNELQMIITNEIKICDLPNIENFDLDILEMAFELMPKITDEMEHKNLEKIIIRVFANNLFSLKRADNINYDIKRKFISKYVELILMLPLNDIADFLNPVIDNFTNSETVADVF